jgi:hypothetical protein
MSTALLDAPPPAPAQTPAMSAARKSVEAMLEKGELEAGVRELQQLYQKAGFTVDNHQTFSPYKDDVDGRVPDIRDALLKLGLNEALCGSTHFIVGRKQSPPTCRAYEPLYQKNEEWSGWPTNA